MLSSTGGRAAKNIGSLLYLVFWYCSSPLQSDYCFFVVASKLLIRSESRQEYFSSMYFSRSCRNWQLVCVGFTILA